MQVIRGTPERVQELRTALDCGIFEAKRKADQEAVLLAIEQMNSNEELKPILRRLAELI